MISQCAAARKQSGYGAHMSASFSVGERHFGPGRALVIAEIGTGHAGDLAKARELVAAAADSGADCAKFQCVFADEIIHPNTGTVPLPGGDIALYDRFLEMEEGPDFYAALKECAEARGLLFLCTPFGLRSARLLRALGCPAMKVASPELNHFPLLAELASYGLPTILSGGVSTLADIDRALRHFVAAGRRDGGASGGPSLALLHCVTAYPAPAADYNLRLLGSLGAIFGVPSAFPTTPSTPSSSPRSRSPRAERSWKSTSASRAGTVASTIP